MSTSSVNVPALPDDTQLSQHIPDWPIFSVIREHLEGLTGQLLFSMGELGEVTMNDLATLDTRLKKAEPAFKHWYEGSTGWHAEMAAEFWRNYRIGRLKELDDVRKQIGRIQADFLKLRDDAIAEQRRQLETQQRQQAEAERQREVEALKAQQTPEAEQAAEQLALEPVIPAAVSKEQAAIAANVPAAPAKVSGRKVYDRTIVDMKAFLTWLAANPVFATTLKLTVNFTAVKSNATAIPGVKITERYETSNRGK